MERQASCLYAGEIQNVVYHIRQVFTVAVYDLEILPHFGRQYDRIDVWRLQDEID